MDFDFKNFSTRSFERFAQAMAMHTLGSGLLIFGDGPDGGREASYEGVLNYPSDGEKWSGYTVMQAKFLQVPGAAKDDADWLVAHLRAELKKFVGTASRLRKPEYYILVSNARLSPVPAGDKKSGGIAKVEAVFAEFNDSIGLKGYSVWHLDKLATMLLNADSLRRTYSAWLSSSDVISEILRGMNERSRSIQDSMYRYLSRELRSHQPIRLQQAGHSGNSQTMIEDVFTDLPFHTSQPRRSNERPDSLLLASLLERSRDCLDGASVAAQQGHENGRPERILLMGGPGQGKSTLSQFLAQIFRASMLRTSRAGQYPAEIGVIIEHTLSKASDSGINIDIPRRFPLRVDLPNFADWLSRNSSDGAASLLHYMAQYINAVANGDVGVSDLRDWISSYPSILILDGLDEVPSSANRGSVVRSINEFWDEATSSDLLMIVTTRPQGYNDDLDPHYYSKLEMTPLAPQQALEYARKLAKSLVPDPLHFERVISRLSEAAESPTTARLLVSPLQVAILLALIDQRGDAPTDRWNLFDKYFAVMLQREQGKAGAVGQVMRHWSRQISAIHYKAGFLLHVEAEIKGNSETHLSLSDLEALIRGQLSDEDYEGADLDLSTRALLEVSTERLVLLVQREEAKFTFEVRSLQEFMAAAYLMTGKEAVVQKRLRTISNREHWLHVFQIAASKCFSVNDAEHYRDTVVAICSELNGGDEEIDRFLKTGSRLALALLDDGLAYDQPKYRRLLFNISLSLLCRGPELLPRSLSDHCPQEPSRTIEQFRHYIGHTNEIINEAAWQLIFYCSAKGQDWFEQLLDGFWPTTPEKAAKLFAINYAVPAVSELHRRMRKTLENTSFIDIVKAFESCYSSSLDFKIENINKNFSCLGLLRVNSGDSLKIKLKIDDVETPLTFKVRSLTVDRVMCSIYNDLPGTEKWSPQNALRDFHNDPSAEKLADLFDDIHKKNWRQDFLRMFHALPWPCAVLFMVGHEKCDFPKVANDLRKGLYGNVDDWRAAEDRWKTKGVDEHDLSKITDGVFFDSSVSKVGLPIPRPIISYSHAIPSSSSELFRKIIPYGLNSIGEVRDSFRQLLDFLLTLDGQAQEISLEAALFFLEEGCDSIDRQWIDPRVLENIPLNLIEDPGLLQRIDRAGQLGEVYLLSASAGDPETIRRLIGKEKDYPGVIIFLLNLVASYQSVGLSVLAGVDTMSLRGSGSELISKYATVIDMILKPMIISDLESVLETNEPRPLPVDLLKQFLEDERLGRDKGLLIAEAIAKLINRGSPICQGIFGSQIQSLASGRLAELHKSACWVELEFGESLLMLSVSRRRSVSIAR